MKAAVSNLQEVLLHGKANVMAGHDFSLFHPAVSLAVVVECSATSSDAERFPLQAEDGKPIIHLSADSVWWVVRS